MIQNSSDSQFKTNFLMQQPHHYESPAHFIIGQFESKTLNTLDRAKDGQNHEKKPMCEKGNSWH